MGSPMYNCNVLALFHLIKFEVLKSHLILINHDVKADAYKL
jgi:hypothetical protein